MGEAWVKEAERWGGGKIGGAMDSPGRPPRAVWHTTESGDGDAAFTAVADYLVRIGAEPHVLYDPRTDRLAQFGPLNQSARALRNDGAVRTNRTGKACIQVEVLARASRPFTGYWRPGPRFRALMRAIRSHGVPDVWPAGRLAAEYGDGHRPRDVWLIRAGHYGHSNVPGNDHWDPGAIDKKALFKAAPTAGGGKPKPPAKAPAFPGAAQFRPGAVNQHVTRLGRALVAKGYGRFYSQGPGPRWTESDRRAVQAFQRAQGWTGSGADGYPGPRTWERLMR